MSPTEFSILLLETQAYKMCLLVGCKVELSLISKLQGFVSSEELVCSYCARTLTHKVFMWKWFNILTRTLGHCLKEKLFRHLCHLSGLLHLEESGKDFCQDVWWVTKKIMKPSCVKHHLYIWPKNAQSHAAMDSAVRFLLESNCRRVRSI